MASVVVVAGLVRQAASQPVIGPCGVGWRAWMCSHAAAWFARKPWWVSPGVALFASGAALVFGVLALLTVPQRLVR